MVKFSFISQCLCFCGSKNDLSFHKDAEVKGTQLVPLDSEIPSGHKQSVTVDSEVPSSHGHNQSVPVNSEVPGNHGHNQSMHVDSELPSSHGQPVLVGTPALSSRDNISKTFMYSELEEATNNFDSSRILGSGGYGTVYHGILEDGSSVAIKHLHEERYKNLRLHDEKLESERLKRFTNEVAVLACLSHENLVQLYGCTSPYTDKLLLVQEYVSNKTVSHHLLSALKKPGTFSWPTRLNVAVQTASALAYLHASNIIHRDVKTSNILFDDNFNAKVADFGLSRLFPLGVTHITTDPAGTLGYTDPEYYQSCHLSDKSDVYSFGVVLIELMSSLPAFSEEVKEPFLSDFAVNKIFFGELVKLVDPALGFGSDDWINQTISAVAELAFQCLQRYRDMRPSMAEVLDTLESIRDGSTKTPRTWAPRTNSSLTNVHIVSRLPDDYFDRKQQIRN
ncbi:hypothetical protein L6164_005352 [Bauhinia variegata]|uniref:Uncharacterized protein n=1 Tax=Bauhinia variegata TaxID=167791 RepID=A0ACB9PQ87_BAUVA|nr:hypothetical protein L6164_005352 [Bauhinia variegata]